MTTTNQQEGEAMNSMFIRKMDDTNLYILYTTRSVWSVERDEVVEEEVSLFSSKTLSEVEAFVSLYKQGIALYD